MDCNLIIGGLRFTIKGAPWSDRTVPANFRPFLADASAGAGLPAVRLSVVTSSSHPALPQSEPISESVNDLGRAALYRSGNFWYVAVTPCPGQYPRIMVISPSLAEATLTLDPADPFATFTIDSMTRILFSQFAASTGALMLHASAVVYDRRAYLFMGKSGTGKSTHSRLWLQSFAGCRLLNDDCPLAIPDPDAPGRFLISGTPWSGKTPCWKNLSFPLGGIARLSQAPANSFSPLAGIEAFIAFIPGMSVMTSDRALYSLASSTALTLLGTVTTGILRCLPDADAARLCRDSLVNPSDNILT